jgi:hypothetical protein
MTRPKPTSPANGDRGGVCELPYRTAPTKRDSSREHAEHLARSRGSYEVIPVDYNRARVWALSRTGGRADGMLKQCLATRTTAMISEGDDLTFRVAVLSVRSELPRCGGIDGGAWRSGQL